MAFSANGTGALQWKRRSRPHTAIISTGPSTPMIATKGLSHFFASAGGFLRSSIRSGWSRKTMAP